MILFLKYNLFASDEMKLFIFHDLNACGSQPVTLTAVPQFLFFCLKTMSERQRYYFSKKNDCQTALYHNFNYKREGRIFTTYVFII